VTLPLIHALWAAGLALAPIALLLSALRDAPGRRRQRWARTRTVGFFLVYLSCEVAGLWLALLSWIGSGVWLGLGRRRFLAWNYALQRWWTGAPLAGARRLYAMPLEVDGVECAARGPYLLFARHTSTADTVVPAYLLANRFGIRLRYVLKRELLWDPCLDVVGVRLPNAFVDRSGAMPERQVAAVAELARGLEPDDGVLIYPEGTRFTPARRERALARLERSAPAEILARARRMTRVLPPRRGGPLALLAAAPGVDVVFLAHTGFEGAVSFGELLRGGLVGRTIRARLWRVAAADIPTDERERWIWLYEQWLRVDEWVEGWSAPLDSRG
jgi:1-acyl-sn-glycerol-3-phosphate acyltransferase